MEVAPNLPEFLELENGCPKILLASFSYSLFSLVSLLTVFQRVSFIKGLLNKSL